MAFSESDRRPGLGGAFLSVYGITREMRGAAVSQTGVARLLHGFLRRTVGALRKRVRPRPARA